MQTIQMHLSQKQIIFSEFLWAFLKSTLNFEPLKTKNHHSLCISETTHPKRCG